jgi:aerobic-type carbon monoxide dehydrogenase small subunit (CoxS/CutS family)
MSEVTTLIVNGASYTVDVSRDRPLLDVLREDLGLTGCKIGCGEGACGACTVLVGDQVTRSCITPIGAALGLSVLTVEGLATHGQLHALQQAFLDADAMQCGYCTPGMIMAALGLLRQNPDPSEDAIIAAMQGNLCRCGTYTRIVRAIQQAALALRALPGGAQ